jgi:hypothetical protein
MSNLQSSDTLIEDAFEHWIDQSLNPLLRDAQLKTIKDSRAVMTAISKNSTVQHSKEYIAGLVWTLKSKKAENQVQDDNIQDGHRISFNLCAYYIQNGGLGLDELGSLGYVFLLFKHFRNGH